MYNKINLLRHKKELPEKVYWSVAEAQEKAKLNDLARFRQHHSSLLKLRDQYSQELKSASGKKNWKKYIQLRRENLKNIEKAEKKFSQKKINAKQLQEYREKCIKESKVIIQSLDIDNKKTIQNPEKLS